MSTNEGAPKLVRDAMFYFSSGDLIVQSAVDASDISTLFRVDKSLLSFNSPVFAGMFSLPNSSGQELYDGAPVVQVTEPATELHKLFTALHNASTLSIPRFDPYIPTRLTPVMRLVMKYEFNNLHARVVDIMNENWPQTFEHWMRFRAEVAVIEELHASAADGLVDGRSFEERIPEPASAIRFARMFDVPSVLPFAFYTLSGIPLSNDWDAVRSARRDEAARQVRTAKWGLLDIADHRAVMQCRERLGRELGEVLYSYTRADLLMERTMADTCASADECANAFTQLVEAWQDCETGVLREEAIGSAAGTPDPLGLLEDLYNSRPEWAMCADCCDRLQKCIRESQHTVWRGLDNMEI
ncbi:hypothetical protein PHLGIDRAFT_13389 [Phlebiopsis gigantea 11061_1 CR5-6]|uniref:BTB domain-containing protein n=1 Tax=Phlebiopsis gigantea (strain 11061_1 CR5-6) TaxID=745531 RepID=A0A0C3NPU2_PHLG1|nr:hypothetical protein PHLGIDRAFT_13389 [Phlebiopsis gigantea 11061_1 CR5-6]